MSNSASGKVEIVIRIDGQNNAGTAIAQTNAQLETLEKRAEGVAIAAAKQTKELDGQINAIKNQNEALKSLGMANGPAFQANYDKLVSLNKKRIELINVEIVGLQRELVEMKKLGDMSSPLADAARTQILLLERKRAEYERLALAARSASDAEERKGISVNVDSGKGFLGLGKGLGDGLTALAGKASLLKAGFDAAKVTVGKVFDAVDAGAAKADRFDALKNSIAGFEGLLQRAKTATQGMIPEAELTKAIALFNSFGLPLGEFDRVLQQASKTAIRTGQDVTQMVDSLVRGVARGSPQILDNLGIIVNMDDVTKRATASTGKLADALTDQDKKAALLALSLEELEKKNINVNMTESRTASVKRLSAAWQDFKDGAEEFLADVATGVIDFFGNLFDSTSAAEKAIQKMANDLPPSLQSFRQAAVSEIGAVEAALSSATKAADIFRRTFYGGSANTEEKGKLEAAIEKMRKEEADKYEAKVAPVRERAASDFWLGGARAQAELKRVSDEAAAEMAANIQRRTENLQRGFDIMVGKRKATDAELEAAQRDFNTKSLEIDQEAESRKDPLKAEIAKREKELDDLSEKRTKALTERSAKEVKAIGDVIIAKRKELEEYRKADEYESKRGRGGGSGPKKKIEDKRIEVEGIDRQKYYDQNFDRSNFAGREADARAKAKSASDAIKAFQERLTTGAGEALAIKDPKNKAREIEKLAAMYKESAEAKLEIERALDAELRRIGYDREQYLADQRQDRLEKEKKMAAEERSKNFETANKAIKAADSVLSTFIKNDKTLAIARIPLALAEAGLAYARGDYFGAGMGLWSAVQFGIVAASGGGGSKGGASGNRSPVRPTSSPREREANTGGNVYNLWGGFLFGTPGELGAKVNGVVRVANGNGFASGAI